MDDVVHALLRHQAGVITRRQAQSCGLAPHDIRRLVRGRRWARLHPGVLLDHTGEPTWVQRAWAAVLATAPAALSHESAVRWHDGRRHTVIDDDPIHVAVDRQRHLTSPTGTVLHLIGQSDLRVAWHLSPPRVRIEHALLDLAAHARDEWAAAEHLAKGVREGLTTPARLTEAMTQRTRLPRRHLLADIIDSLADGVRSPLERAYITQVERPHRLPTGVRQAAERTASGRVYRDVALEEYGVLLELDGAAHHGGPTQRARDMSRDLEAASGGRVTVRLGWRQVTRDACLTAHHLGALLRRRGWTRQPRTCPACPPVTRWPLM